MKTRIQKVKKEYATEMLVGLVVLTAVISYAYLGSWMLSK
jgi:hypothetical protein